MMRRLRVPIILACMCGGTVPSCSSSTGRGDTTDTPPGDPTAEYQALRDAHVAQWQDLERQWGQAWWDAALSGADEDFERAQGLELQTRRLHSDRATFERLRAMREGGEITDPLLARSLEILYWSFHENQIEDDLMQRIVAAQTELEQTFNTHRPEVDGERVTANEIRGVLQDSTDSDRRRVMWDASKDVGRLIAPRLVELAHMRNEAAQALGHENYYEMMLRVREQDPAEIQRIFDELAEMTDVPFRAAKADLDRQLAERYGIDLEELRPWHYGDPFFQESPGTGIDLDPMFASEEQQHLVGLAQRFFGGIGLPVVDEILERSDLFEREGKVEHAFCTHIDRAGDVRILTNLQNNERWAGTLLHELGHGVYDAHIDQALPFELREPGHIFATEGVAELFGMLTRDATWLRRNASIPEDGPADLDALVGAEHRIDLLIFARWTLVMINFERGLYENPDQDLNRLWWDLVQRFQGITPPDDVEGGTHFATKIHLVVAPVYYHNYMLGRMYAAQLRHRLGEQVPATMAGGSFDMTGQTEVGRYLIDNVFRPGASYPWPEFVERSTGEPMTARYFAAAIALPEPAAAPAAEDAPPASE